jgi:hypothetical protein
MISCQSHRTVWTKSYWSHVSGYQVTLHILLLGKERNWRKTWGPGPALEQIWFSPHCCWAMWHWAHSPSFLRCICSSTTLRGRMRRHFSSHLAWKMHNAGPDRPHGWRRWTRLQGAGGSWFCDSVLQVTKTVAARVHSEDEWWRAPMTHLIICVVLVLLLGKRLKHRACQSHPDPMDFICSVNKSGSAC